VGGTLDGRVAVCTGADQPLGRGLALALAGAGAAIALLGNASGLAAVVADLEARDARAVAVATDLASREAADLAFGTASDQLGGPIDIVLHASVPAIAYDAIAFEDVDDARWEAVWEQTMRTTLFVFQAGYAQMHGRGGRFVIVTPTLSMVGAARFVPYTTAVEGQRLLAKSAARQWGSEGITVNCLAPAPELLPVEFDAGSTSIAAPALGGPGDIERDVGPVAVLLASDEGHFVTGATVCADGGVAMAP
jgi:NAD(P)-dependent dehydrogenase (short-subunit alcohol dehydrogenase family)